MVTTAANMVRPALSVFCQTLPIMVDIRQWISVLLAPDEGR